MKRSAILTLQTDTGLLIGIRACSDYLHHKVADFLLHPAVLDHEDQLALLHEVDKVFTYQDNEMIISPPTKEEIKASVNTSNTVAAPEIDGVISLVYKKHFDILHDALIEVA